MKPSQREHGGDIHMKMIGWLHMFDFQNSMVGGGSGLNTALAAVWTQKFRTIELLLKFNSFGRGASAVYMYRFMHTHHAASMKK